MGWGRGEALKSDLGKEQNMDYVRVTDQGQLTLPLTIRQKLNAQNGGNVVFFEEDGRIIVENASMRALLEAREAMRGVAERLGIKDEQDVVDMVKEVRSLI